MRRKSEDPARNKLRCDIRIWDDWQHQEIAQSNEFVFADQNGGSHTGTVQCVDLSQMIE
jgi:hypothetical protein